MSDSNRNHPHVVVLGAGFGGMELSTLLSEALGASANVTLVDRGDAFVFGYAKLDVMFGRQSAEAVRLPYARFVKPGVRFVQTEVTAIDPVSRRVQTTAGELVADHLVVALGAEYDLHATPGLAETNEFYSVKGAERLAAILPGFSRGHAVIGVCGAPFKCPPAPSECALMLHDHLVQRGIRGDCEISLVLPLGTPVPPSPETSEALLAAFGERGIRFVGGKRIAAVDNARNVATCDDGTEIPFDLFLGVPKHQVPRVVIDAGLSENGWIPVNPRTLRTAFERVYAVGDCAATGTPKAGVFAEGAAKAVASAILADIRGEGQGVEYDGFGTCYIEFGADRIGKVEVDFFSGPKPTGKFHGASSMMKDDKVAFGATRRRRWFGLPAIVAGLLALTMPGIAERARAATDTAVSTLTVAANGSADWNEYHGVVASRHSVPLIAMVSGRVRVVHVAAGQTVRKGQPLVELESQDYQARAAAAESRLSSARALLEDARSDYERNQTLVAKGLISAQTLGKLQAGLLAAEGREAEAAAGLKEARTQLAYTVLRSPIDGIVIDKQVDPGDYSMPGVPAAEGFPGGRILMKVYDPKSLWFEARVPERLAGYVRVGGGVTVTLPSAGRSLQGKFIEVVPQVDGTARTFVARIDLPTDPALKLGMYGRARFASGQSASIEVPATAVLERGQLDTVFVAEAGRASLRMVRLGRRKDGNVEILSGLRPGEKVLVRPAAGLRDGDAL